MFQPYNFYCELVAVLIIGVNVAVALAGEMHIHAVQNLLSLSDIVHIFSTVKQHVNALEIELVVSAAVSAEGLRAQFDKLLRGKLRFCF